MTLERILLQTIKFDLQLEHPYKYLLKYANCLKGEKTRLEKMVQMAWNFINDRYDRDRTNKIIILSDLNEM
jgi:hypothetical protein